MKSVAVVCALVCVVWSVDSMAVNNEKTDVFSARVLFNIDPDQKEEVEDFQLTEESAPQKAFHGFQKLMCGKNVTLQMESAETETHHSITKRSPAPYVPLPSCKFSCGWSGCKLDCQICWYDSDENLKCVKSNKK